jgi:hypothetical protein
MIEPGSTLGGSKQKEALVQEQKFYIKLGRHPLDRSFMLNSNSILIY